MDAVYSPYHGCIKYFNIVFLTLFPLAIATLSVANVTDGVEMARGREIKDSKNKNKKII